MGQPAGNVFPGYRRQFHGSSLRNIIIHITDHRGSAVQMHKRRGR